MERQESERLEMDLRMGEAVRGKAEIQVWLRKRQ